MQEDSDAAQNRLSKVGGGSSERQPQKPPGATIPKYGRAYRQGHEEADEGGEQPVVPLDKFMVFEAGEKMPVTHRPGSATPGPRVGHTHHASEHDERPD